MPRDRRSCQWSTVVGPAGLVVPDEVVVAVDFHTHRSYSFAHSQASLRGRLVFDQNHAVVNIDLTVPHLTEAHRIARSAPTTPD